jgi:ribosomal protein S12 methylthiotransferase
VDVIMDRREDEFVVGRTRMDAPEIDNEVLIRDCTFTPGRILPVVITESTEYDLFGHPA